MQAGGSFAGFPTGENHRYLPDEGEPLPDEDEHLPDEDEHLPDEGEHLPDEGEHLPDEDEHLPDEGKHLPDEGKHLFIAWVAGFGGRAPFLAVAVSLREDARGNRWHGVSGREPDFPAALAAKGIPLVDGNGLRREKFYRAD